MGVAGSWQMEDSHLQLMLSKLNHVVKQMKVNSDESTADTTALLQSSVIALAYSQVSYSTVLAGLCSRDGNSVSGTVVVPGKE